MDAEEGELGIGDRVDQVAHEGLGLCAELEVFATEGDDAGRGSFAGECHDAVAMEAGAVDEIVRLHGAASSLAEPAVVGSIEREEGSIGFDLASARVDVGLHCAADSRVIDDAFFGDFNGGEASDIRFTVFDFSLVEPAEAFEAVGGATIEELSEAGDFVLGDGDDEFAADLMGNVVLFAELNHSPDAIDGELGFERARLIVEAGVEDAAVVAALVLADLGFLLDDGDPGVGPAELGLVGGGQANDAAADDGEAIGRRCHAAPLFIFETDFSEEVAECGFAARAGLGTSDATFFIEKDVERKTLRLDQWGQIAVLTEDHFDAGPGIFLQVSINFVAGFADVDSNDDEALVGKLLRELLNDGLILAAIAAPSGPELDEDGFALDRAVIERFSGCAFGAIDGHLVAGAFLGDERRGEKDRDQKGLH